MTFTFLSSGTISSLLQLAVVVVVLLIIFGVVRLLSEINKRLHNLEMMMSQFRGSVVGSSSGGSTGQSDKT